jgi:hypothetical protein
MDMVIAKSALASLAINVCDVLGKERLHNIKGCKEEIASAEKHCHAMTA